MLPRCQICGHHLRLPEFLRHLFRRTALVYPARLMSGARTDKAVRWICPRCLRRGEQINAQGEEKQ